MTTTKLPDPTPWDYLTAVVLVVALGVALLFGFGAVGCAPTAAYVEADRATYEAVWPEYQRYYEADASLTEEDVLDRDGLGRSWAARIAAGEAETGSER